TTAILVPRVLPRNALSRGSRLVSNGSSVSKTVSTTNTSPSCVRTVSTVKIYVRNARLDGESACRVHERSEMHHRYYSYRSPLIPTIDSGSHRPQSHSYSPKATNRRKELCS